ncbi:hypothetical protein Tco_1072288 [Tanacetum coccineum]
MTPQTRSNPVVTKEVLDALRGPIVQLMREEMEKLRDKIRSAAIEASTSTIMRNQGWMYKCEQYFRVDNVLDEQKIPLISIHLTDIALMWHRQFMRLLGSDIVPWLVYRYAIMHRFGNSFDDLLAELKNYQAISFYMAGLPMDIELAVRMFKPQTLSIAYSLSKLQFETNEASKKKYKPPILPTPRFNNHSVGGTQINSPKPLALPALNANWRSKSDTP